jgi:4-carboxymuconolactone decarboxylase
MRLAVLSSEEMSPEQLDLYREILGGPRGQGPRAVLLSSGAGGLAGPFNAMLYAPPVGHALQELGAAIRFRSELAPRIREMAILVVAQAWDSEYERASHEPIGREAGLTEPEIEALRVGADPGFADKQEQVAYSVVRALTSPAPDLDDQEYATAAAELGEQALVELSTLVGYYATLALQMRIFRVPVRRQTLDSSGTWEWESVPELSSPLWDSRSTLSDQIRPVQCGCMFWLILVC